jgi:hypothetical protein
MVRLSGAIFLPVSIDVLDLQRYLTGERIALVPPASLAVLTKRMKQILAYDSVEVLHRRKFAGLPGRD